MSPLFGVPNWNDVLIVMIMKYRSLEHNEAPLPS